MSKSINLSKIKNAIVVAMILFTIVFLSRPVKTIAAESHDVKLPIAYGVQYSYDKKYAFNATMPERKKVGETINVGYMSGEKVYIKIDSDGSKYFLFESSDTNGKYAITETNQGNPLEVKDNVYSFVMPENDVELKVFDNAADYQKELATLNGQTTASSNTVDSKTDAGEERPHYTFTPAEKGNMLLPVDMSSIEESLGELEDEWADIQDVVEQVKKSLVDGIYFDVTTTSRFEFETGMSSVVKEATVSEPLDYDSYQQGYEVVIEDSDGNPMDFDLMSGYLTFESKEMQDYFRDYGVKIFVKKDGEYKEISEITKPANTEDEIVVYEYDNIEPVFILSIDKPEPVEDDIDPENKESEEKTPSVINPTETELNPSETELATEASAIKASDESENTDSNKENESSGAKDTYSEDEDSWKPIETETTAPTIELGNTGGNASSEVGPVANTDNTEETNKPEGTEETDKEKESKNTSEKKNDSKESVSNDKYGFGNNNSGLNQTGSTSATENATEAITEKEIKHFEVNIVNNIGKTVDSVYGEIRKDGKKVEDLESGKTEYETVFEPGEYEFVITEVPDGYKEPASIKYTITPDTVYEPVSITIEKSLITVKCTVDGKPYEGKDIELNIINSYSMSVFAGNSGDSVEGIPSGSYVLTTTSLPKKYVTPKPVALSITGKEDGEEYTIDIKTVKASLKVVDVNTGEEISDFNIKLAGDKEFNVSNTEDIEGIERGKYKVSFNSLDNRYRIPADGIKEIEIADVETEQPFIFEVGKTNVMIGRLDESDNLVAGCKLALYDESGKEVESWDTEDSLHNISGLPAGKYVVKETAIKDGLEKATDKEFELTQEDKDVTVVVRTEKQGFLDKYEKYIPVAGGGLGILLLAILALLISNLKKKPTDSGNKNETTQKEETKEKEPAKEQPVKEDSAKESKKENSEISE